MKIFHAKIYSVCLAALPGVLLIALSAPYRVRIGEWGCTAWPQYHYEIGAILTGLGIKVGWLRQLSSTWLLPVFLGANYLGAIMLYFSVRERFRTLGLSLVIFGIAWFCAARLLWVLPCSMSVGSAESMEAWKKFNQMEGVNN